MLDETFRGFMRTDFTTFDYRLTIEDNRKKNKHVDFWLASAQRDLDLPFLSVCPSDCLSRCGVACKRMHIYRQNFWIICSRLRFDVSCIDCVRVTLFCDLRLWFAISLGFFEPHRHYKIQRRTRSGERQLHKVGKIFELRFSTDIAFDLEKV